MELSKGSGFALALTVTPATAEAFCVEMPIAKQALLDWNAKRGRHCDRAMFTVVCESEHHAAIDEAIGHIYRDETQLAPLFRSVDVHVALMKPRAHGKAEKEYTLKCAVGN